MQMGTITWFSGPRGYGFIAPDDGSEDVFVHHTQINDGQAPPELLQRVSFDPVEGIRGRHADNVHTA